MAATFHHHYEFLPEYDDLSPGIYGQGNFGKRPRNRNSGQQRYIQKTIRRRPALLCIVTSTFFSLALTLLAFDFLYMRGELARARLYYAATEKLWPVDISNRTDSWENENHKAMHSLMNCIRMGTCGRNQKSIVMLSSFHFPASIAGKVSGEEIWATSLIDAIKDLGYTPIITDSNEHMARTYRQFTDLIKIIIVEGSDARACFANDTCIKSAQNPLGIPVWKMFSFHFWRGASHPLGSAWTLSPEDYGIISPSNSIDNVYLGYSIEKTCTQIPFTPSEERPKQAYVLAKQTKYFYGNDYAWAGFLFDPPPIDVELIAGISPSISPKQTTPIGITNLGKLNKTTFYHHLSRSRALVGVGLPFVSPSPYDALCMGVPFINPILGWNEADPDDRSYWNTQHDGLKFLDPPYVYNVRRGDEDGFWDALDSAMSTPIGRFIKPEMTMEAVRSRVSSFIEYDWEEKASLLLTMNQLNEKGQPFYL